MIWTTQNAQPEQILDQPCFRLRSIVLAYLRLGRRIRTAGFILVLGGSPRLAVATWVYDIRGTLPGVLILRDPTIWGVYTRGPLLSLAIVSPHISLSNLMTEKRSSRGIKIIKPWLHRSRLSVQITIPLRHHGLAGRRAGFRV